MALPAGRKGVLPSEITPEGKLKIPTPPSELPSYSSSDEGKVLSVDSNGNLEFITPEKELPSYSSSDEGKVLGVNSSGELEFVGIVSGLHLYRKTWKPNTVKQDNPVSGQSWYSYENQGIGVGIAGYTPLFVHPVDVYSGYGIYGGCLTKQGDAYFANAILKRSTNDEDAVRFIVYYAKNDELTITDLT